MRRQSKKKGGLIGNLIAGVGSLIVLTIVIFVVVSSILDANILGTSQTTVSVNNEIGWGNATDYQLGVVANSSNTAFTLTNASNYTSKLLIGLGNFTVNSVTGIVTNSTVTAWHNVSYNYTYAHTLNSNEQTIAEDMNKNFTEGIQNVSEKIPTILLIGAVILLFGVIVLLVKQSQAMGIGNKGGSL